MNKEKRRVPKLRFPGFTEDWEQRKLGQFTARVTRKNGGQSDLPLTISAQDGLVDQRKYFNRQVASRDMSNYYLIKKGEFAYNKSYSEGYPFGAVKRLDYYDIGALSTLYILFEITDKNISSDFIVSYYMTHLWYKEISKRAAEGARNHGLLNISTEDFFDSELNIPNSIEEQVKIGNFIKEFDKFITLHQRKLEHLNLKKKALLQKLFPKNGECYPELRFPGFTDAWEQRKFSDITYLSGVKNKENKPYESYSISNEFGFIPQNEQFENGGTMKTADKSMYYIVSKNSFAYNPARINVGSIGYYDKPDIVIVSSLYEVFKTIDVVDDKFLWHWFKSDQFNRLVDKYQEGGVRLYFYYDKLCKGRIGLPSISEQNKISNLLDYFDKYITLHQ